MAREHADSHAYASWLLNVQKCKLGDAEVAFQTMAIPLMVDKDSHVMALESNTQKVSPKLHA